MVLYCSNLSRRGTVKGLSIVLEADKIWGGMQFDSVQIRLIRQRLGWSLAEMARRMGCREELVRDWENGLCVPDEETHNQLAHLSSQAESQADHLKSSAALEGYLTENGLEQTHRDDVDLLN